MVDFIQSIQNAGENQESYQNFKHAATISVVAVSIDLKNNLLYKKVFVSNELLKYRST